MTSKTLTAFLSMPVRTSAREMLMPAELIALLMAASRPGRVDAGDLDLHRTEVAVGGVPRDLDPALRIALHDAQAVDGVHGDAAAAGDEADDALARAADCSSGRSAPCTSSTPLTWTPPLLCRPTSRKSFCSAPSLALLARRSSSSSGTSLASTCWVGEPAVADRGDQRLLVLEAELLGGALELAALAELAELVAIAAEVAVEELGADLETAAALLDLDPVADALLGARGRDDLQPVLARGLARGGDDLDRVAALQLVLAAARACR